MNIAVIGAGIYGCTIALTLAKGGFRVTLLEKASDILTGASFISRRSHRGYFYGRSVETLLDCKTYAPLFEEHYQEAIITDIATYYAVAREGSKLTFEEFTSTLERHALPHQKETSPLLNSDAVAGSLLVGEHYFDPFALRRVLRKRLRESGVRLLLNTDARRHPLDRYDLKIVALYADTRLVAELFGSEGMIPSEYRLCEKVVVTLPPEFRRTSFVVVDGPFFQIEPFGRSEGQFVMSHFLHSTHEKSTAETFSVSARLRDFLGKEVVDDRKGTRFPAMRDDVSRFIPKITTARYAGSIYAIKPILNAELEDRRPVVVRTVRDDVLVAFSGKVSGSIKAADDCLAYAKRYFRKRNGATASKRRTASMAI